MITRDRSLVHYLLPTAHFFPSPPTMHLLRLPLAVALAFAVLLPAPALAQPAPPAPPPAESTLDLVAARTALIPKREVGADAFLRAHPTYDGRGVVIAVFDTGVDPAAPGLATTTTGERKVIDLIDASGSGDVDTSTKSTPAADGTLPGLSGRPLTLPAGLVNPTGEFRLGLKPAAELFPTAPRSRLNAHRESTWRARVTAARATPERQPSAALRAARTAALADRTRAQLDLIARADALAAAEDAYLATDPAPLHDCVLWHDGTHWRVLVDTNENGDLRDETVLRPYGVAGEFATFDPHTHATFGVQVYENGDLLSIVTTSGTHGTHVAAIAAAHFPADPARHGIAPGAQILSIKIGDIRTGGSSYGTPEQRAIAAAARHKVDIMNASWGGVSVFQDGDDANARFYRTLTDRYDILAVMSAGNNGPALSTAGSAGGETSRILGVGAYVSTEMGRILYNTLAASPSPDSALQFTSRGPTKDGDLGVDLLAPGAAWASYSAESLRGAAMINGTSMAAPSASGVAALVLSAAKQESLNASPARIHAALVLGSTALPDLEPATQGAGLVSAAGTWAKLRALQDEPAFGAFYDLSITGGSFTSSGRGLYLREAITQPRRSITARITPDWTESTSYADRFAFETSLELRPAHSWVETPDFLHLANGPQSIPIHLTVPTTPGLITSRIDAFLPGRADLGPVFSIPITIVNPAPADTFTAHRHATTLDLAPSATRRLFFSTPPNATLLRLRVTHHAADPVARRFVIHSLSPAAHSPFYRHEFESAVGLKAGEERVFDLPVRPGAVTEIAFHQFFSSPSSARLDAEFEWLGLGLPNAPATLTTNQGWTTLELTGLGDHTVNVSSELQHAVRALLPTKTARLPMDERAELPASPLTTGPVRPTFLRQTFELSFTEATKAVLLGSHDFDSSELLGGGPIVVQHESGALLHDGSGGIRNVIDFPAGKTTVIRDFTAADPKLLDYAEHLPLRVAEPVKGKPGLAVFADLRSSQEGSATKTFSLADGRERILFLQDSVIEALAELKPAPHYVLGELTFKDTADRTLAEHPLIYLVGASPKKTTNADAKAKPATDPHPAPEQLADSLYASRLAFIRDHRAKTDAATQDRRRDLLDELRAERPADPAPIFEAALDAALDYRLAHEFWGKLGEPTTTTPSPDASPPPELPAPEAATTPTPVPAPDLTQVDAVLALLDAAHIAAEPDAVRRFLGTPASTAPGYVAARHAREREEKKFHEARDLLAKIERLRADVLRAAGRLDDAWTAHTAIASWETKPAKDTALLTIALYRASDLLGLALQALDARLKDTPHDAALLKERIALYRELGWADFAAATERTLALRAHRLKRPELR